MLTKEAESTIIYRSNSVAPLVEQSHYDNFMSYEMAMADGPELFAGQSSPYRLLAFNVNDPRLQFEWLNDVPDKYRIGDVIALPCAVNTRVPFAVYEGKDAIMQRSGLSSWEEVYEAVRKLTSAHVPVVPLPLAAYCEDIDAAFTELSDVKRISPSMPLVVTTSYYDPLSQKDTRFGGYFGSGILFCPEVFGQLCRVLGSDSLTILPSSIAELIVVSNTGAFAEAANDKDFCAAMVENVNTELVMPQGDYLSDQVFVYERGKGVSAPLYKEDPRR